MRNTLSIRSYSRQRLGHKHDFYQLVLPLSGVINIEFSSYAGKISPGECIVIKRGESHHFTADPHAKFVVADMDTLPSNLRRDSRVAFAISSPLMKYLSFIETQLQQQVNPALEDSMFATFVLLLAEQKLTAKVDHRIQAVLQHIHLKMSDTLTIRDLASVACLSETQFKKLFQREVGLTVMKYITNERMEKAKALLQHTDYPIQLISEQVGYTDVSAFGRRFTLCFGLSPSQFRC